MVVGHSEAAGQTQLAWKAKALKLVERDWIAIRVAKLVLLYCCSMVDL